MKKIFLIFSFLTIFIFAFNFNSSYSSASIVDHPAYTIVPPELSNNPYFITQSDSHSYYMYNGLWILHDNSYFYVYEGNILLSGKASIFYVDSDGSLVSDTFSSGGPGAASVFVSTIKEGTATIYKDIDKSEVFFSAPSPYAMDMKVEEIPQVMTETLVDGGVLSTALIVLAIMLGVLLVRRFPFWFLR